MDDPAPILVDDPDGRRYTIVSLRPVVIKNITGNIIQIGFRSLTVRVFDDADDVLFDVRTIVPMNQVTQAELRLIAETKWRITAQDWTVGQTYEL
jgi:hypothetical protein